MWYNDNFRAGIDESDKAPAYMDSTLVDEIVDKLWLIFRTYVIYKPQYKHFNLNKLTLIQLTSR